ncbi:MAG: hypothetical protein ACLTYC_10235, partial [Ruminococcus callidus]|uniref:hypothetical protein n=1 Tax=Ruminococcus callidus TaxID=40519 RepID=UPI0039940D5A
ALHRFSFESLSNFLGSVQCVVLLHFSFLMFWGQIGVKIGFSVKMQQKPSQKLTSQYLTNALE